MPSPVVDVVVGEVVDRAAHVARRTIRGKRVHQLGGFVHLRVLSKLAVVQIGSEGDEAGRRQAICHLLDTGVEAPPFLHHDDTGACARLGHSEVPACVVAVACEFDDFSHAPTVDQLRSVCAGRRLTASRQLPPAFSVTSVGA